MLVLSRKLGESVVVSDNQNEVWIKVVRISGGRVQIAFNAPIDVAIRRGELLAPEPDSDPVETLCIITKDCDDVIQTRVVQALGDHRASHGMGSTRAGVAPIETTCLGVSPFGVWTMGLRS